MIGLYSGFRTFGLARVSGTAMRRMARVQRVKRFQDECDTRTAYLVNMVWFIIQKDDLVK